MAIEEKLKYFYDSAMSSLKEKNDKEIESMREYLEADLAQYKKERAEETREHEKLHVSEIKRQMQKNLAARKLSIRREKSKEEAEIKEKLFEEAGTVLDAYRKTEGYRESLADNIKKIKEFAGEDEVLIYICESDKALKDELERECGISLILSEVPFNGGVQAEIPSRNIFINDSYSSIMDEEKDAYIVKP